MFLELGREFVQFGYVILHIFVPRLGVPFRNQSGIFVSGDLFACSRDVVADLVAGLVILSALDGKFERRRAIARGGGDLL